VPYGVTSFVHNVEHGCLPESVAATDRLLGISSSEISANIIVMQYSDRPTNSFIYSNFKQVKSMND